MKIIIKKEYDTFILSKKICSIIKKPAIIYLNGKLGAGKTTFARGFIKSYGYKFEIKSPTFSIVNEYNNFIMPIFHFDFYRIQKYKETELIIFNDYFKKKAIILVEWAEKMKYNFCTPDLIFNFTQKKQHKEIFLHSNTKYGKKIVLNLI